MYPNPITIILTQVTTLTLSLSPKWSSSWNSWPVAGPDPARRERRRLWRRRRRRIAGGRGRGRRRRWWYWGLGRRRSGGRRCARSPRTTRRRREKERESGWLSLDLRGWSRGRQGPPLPEKFTSVATATITGMFCHFNHSQRFRFEVKIKWTQILWNSKACITV